WEHLQNTEMIQHTAFHAAQVTAFYEFNVFGAGIPQNHYKNRYFVKRFGPDTDRCPSPSVLACRWVFHIAVRQVLSWLAGKDEHMLLKCSFRRRIQVLAVVPTEQHS